MSPPFICTFFDSTALGWSNKQARAGLVPSFVHRSPASAWRRCTPWRPWVALPPSVHMSLHFMIGGSAFRASRMRAVVLQIYLQFFPDDVSNDAAFFHVLLAACVCQNLLIACDRGTQITKVFPVAQEQMNNDPTRLRLRENRMRNVHLSAVKNWLCSLTMIWIWMEFWIRFGKVAQQGLLKTCQLPVIAAICS